MDNTSQPEQIEILLKNIEWYKKLVREKEQRIKELEAVKKYTECWNDYQKQFAEITLKNGKLEEENQRLREFVKKVATADILVPRWIREGSQKALEE